MYQCRKCGAQWDANYCPTCSCTIDHSEFQARRTAKQEACAKCGTLIGPSEQAFVLNGAIVCSMCDSRFRNPRSGTKKSLLMTIGVALGILVSCLILILFVFIWLQSSSSKLPLREMQFGKCPGGHVLISSDSKRIAYGIPKDKMTHFVIDGAHEKAYDRVYHLRFSPDSKHFMYVAGKDSKRFLVMDGVEGKYYDSISNITISNDGKRLAYVAGQRVGKSETDTDIGGIARIVSEPIIEDAKRYRYTTGPSRERVVIDGQEQQIYGAIHSVRFSSSGKRLAYVAMQGDKWIVVVDGDDGPVYDDIIRGSLSFDSEERLIYAAKSKLPRRNWELQDRYKWIVNVAGQDSLEYTNTSQSSIVSSEDGKQVAYIAKRSTKWFVIVNGHEGPEYDGIMKGSIIISQDGKHVAYAVKKVNKWSVIVDGREGIAYDGIGQDSLIFGPNQTSVAYTARRGDKCLVVVDGEEGPEFDGIAQGSILFSPDSQRVAYVAGKGDNRLVVVDGKEEPEYHSIHKGSLIFSPDGKRLAYAAHTGLNWRVVCDGSDHGKYDYINFIIFSPDSQRFAYSALMGKTKVTLAEDEYDEMKMPGITQFDKRGFPVGTSKSTTVKNPNAKGEKRIRRSAGKWCVVIDGVQGRKYEMVVNGTFSPDSKHFVYWAKTGEKWAVVLDDMESNSCCQLLHAASKGTIYPHEGPVTLRPEELFFVHGMGLYCLSYGGSQFIFDRPGIPHTFAKHDDILCRLEIDMSKNKGY